MSAPNRLDVLASDMCGLEHALLSFDFGPPARSGLDTGSGWVRRWSTGWRVNGAKVLIPVGELASSPLTDCEPVRRFGWRTAQRHRPGLQFLVSTGRHHGFESLEEQRVLLALDFFGVAQVISQPFRLTFTASGDYREHIPDFLAVFRDGSTWVVDVRPQARVDERARVSFAAAAEAALSAGWRYTVVAGWRPHVSGVLEALSSQRRPLTDVCGVQDQLLDAVEPGSCPFGTAVAATSLPAVARAHALHLLWHRRLGVNLAQPLTDRSLIWRAGSGPS